MTFPTVQRNWLQTRIEAIMRHPDGQSQGSLAKLLWVMSRGYGGVMAGREWLYAQGLFRSRQLPVRVISVGNLSVGGTGKTPFTVFLANLLQQAGRRVVIVTRGYGGSAGRRPTVVSDGKAFCIPASRAGDEAAMMAALLPQIPVVVGHKRYDAGQLAIRRFAPEVILLDDAFQHRALKRNLNIVLLDGRNPLGNGHLLPRGILREPLQALERADILVLTRGRQPRLPRELARAARHKAVFYTRHEPYLQQIIRRDRAKSCNPCEFLPEHYAQQPVYAFSGVADNPFFYRTLQSWNWWVRGFEGFADHHDYTRGELETLAHNARTCGAAWLVTTHKDYMRLVHKYHGPMNILVIGVRIGFYRDDARRLRERVLSTVRS